MLLIYKEVPTGTVDFVITTQYFFKIGAISLAAEYTYVKSAWPSPLLSGVPTAINIAAVESVYSNLIPNLESSIIFSWSANFIEVLISCGFLILVAKKENPNINSRQILLIIVLLLVVQAIKNIFGSVLSPLSIIVPPALIISQGMGTITALTWISIASLSWPELLTEFNNNLLVIGLLSWLFPNTQ